jgi:NAD(P)-dependent dehydrogenase (short-subunit alcohol dehydrogenase family)
MGVLHDRVAFITGAGQGLGKAIALEFAQEGAKVALVERNPRTLEETLAEIREAGGKAEGYNLDITDYPAYEEAMGNVVKQFGRLDVLVNNAAIATYNKIMDMTLEQWRETITVNLEAVFMGSKFATQHMIPRKSGRIISITSIQGFVASGDCGHYNAAKGGIIALTRSMAVELAPYNILVNCVAPGFMRTPMSVIDGVDETTAPEFTEWYVKRRKVPLGRTGYPEDVSGAVVFLASDYCRYLTGQMIVIDGGLTSTF